MEPRRFGTGTDDGDGDGERGLDFDRKVRNQR
jgi:hypothetical protein